MDTSHSRCHDKAEADVVFDMPISPKTNKSQFDGTESKPVCIADITSSFSIAKFSEKSFVGSSKSNGSHLISDQLIHITD